MPPKKKQATTTTTPKKEAAPKEKKGKKAEPEVSPVVDVEPVEEEVAPKKQLGKKSKAEKEPTSGRKKAKKEEDEQQEVEEEVAAPKVKLTKIGSVGVTRVETPARPVPGTMKTFTIISWNVNGLRSVVDKSLTVLNNLVKKYNPDVLCLQETKLQDMHVKDIKILPDYDSYWSCSQEKKGYAGTVVFTKKMTPPVGVSYGLGKAKHDGEGRIIVAEFKDFFLVPGYIPNSGQKLERLNYRVKEWDVDFRAFLKDLEKKKPVIVTGDLNVAHLDADIYNVGQPHVKKTAGCTPEERASFTQFLKEGFVDTFRHFHPDAQGVYTYWSARTSGRDTNKGLRLDYFVVSDSLVKGAKSPKVYDSLVLDADTVGVSDHCPVALVLSY